MIGRRFWAITAAVLVLAGCVDDGRELTDPPNTTESFLVPDDASDPISEGARGDELVAFSLTSPAFAQGGLIDLAYTCHGENIIPPLAISGVPDAAVELAITVVDDADGFVHWVVAGLPASLTELNHTTVHPGVFGLTDDGVLGWSGPCPPEGDGLHTYIFTVYAFAEPLGMEPGLDGRQAVEVIDQTAMNSASLTGFYAAP